MSEGLRAFVEALERVSEPTSCRGTEKVGALEVVLPDGERCAVGEPKFVDWLLENSEDAPFGNGTATVVDHDIRRTQRLVGRGRVQLVGFTPPVAAIAAKLAPRGRVRAKLTDILVYPVGGKFGRHKDTPKSQRLLGTLIVGLPIAYSGGEMKIDDGLERFALDWGSRELDASKLPWVAMFGDVDHSIGVVTRGYRVTAVYALEAVHDPAAPLDRLADVDEALVKWIAEDKGLASGGVLMVPCSRHLIAPKDGPPSTDGLRGVDRDLVDLFAKHDLAVTLRPCLGITERGEKAHRKRMEGADTIVRLAEELPRKFPWGQSIKLEGDSGSTHDGEDELEVMSLENHLLCDQGVFWAVRKNAAATFEHEALFSSTGYFGNEHHEACFYSLVALEVQIGRVEQAPRAAIRRVRHAKFGDGDVIAEVHDGKNTILEIRFESGETRKLVERFVQPI